MIRAQVKGGKKDNSLRNGKNSDPWDSMDYTKNVGGLSIGVIQEIMRKEQFPGNKKKSDCRSQSKDSAISICISTWK